MRIGVRVNSSSRFVASQSGPGFLSAHLNLSDRPKDSTRDASLEVIGIGTGSDTENVTQQWPAVELEVGDRVEIEILDEGPGTEPASVDSSRDVPGNLFSDVALARRALDIARSLEDQLLDLLRVSASVEPPDEQDKVRRAVGRLVYEIGQQLLYPVWRRHPDLIPDEMRGELL